MVLQPSPERLTAWKSIYKIKMDHWGPWSRDENLGRESIMMPKRREQGAGTGGFAMVQMWSGKSIDQGGDIRSKEKGQRMRRGNLIRQWEDRRVEGIKCVRWDFGKGYDKLKSSFRYRCSRPMAQTGCFSLKVVSGNQLLLAEPIPKFSGILRASCYLS